MSFRVADLLVLAAIVGLLLAWLHASGMSRAARVWAAVALLGFYLTTTEWVDCQPDPWMLLPALAALHLRRKQVAALDDGGRSSWRAAAWGFVEGLLWGAACLIKPFAAVPALLAWLASAALQRRSGPGWLGRLVSDTAGLIAGGLVMAALWQGWLIANGTFHDYWHNYAMFRQDYYARSRNFGQRNAAFFKGMLPWKFLHLAALPVATVSFVRPWRARWAPKLEAAQADSLLAGLYLGWVVEANYLQSQLDYHQVPAILLGLTLLLLLLGRAAHALWARVVLAGFVALAVAVQPAVRPERLALWGRCWREGPTPDLKEALNLTAPCDFPELERVANFLREQGVSDGEVLCYDFNTTLLNAQLGLRPASRFLYPARMMDHFASQRDNIFRELRAGPQRFIVTDMRELLKATDKAYAERPGDPYALPPDVSDEDAQRWPYCEPVVFRAGRYFVHQACCPAAGKSSKAGE